MDQGYVPVHQQPYYGSSLMSHHSPPFPPGAGPDDGKFWETCYDCLLRRLCS